jgi:hypothetical protein
MAKKTIVLGIFLFLSMSIRAIEIVTISAAITLAKLGWDVSKTTYRYFWPRDEEILKQHEAIKKLKIIQAEKPLSDCYFNHENDPFNDDCIPCACADAMKKYEHALGLREAVEFKRLLRQNTPARGGRI